MKSPTHFWTCPIIAASLIGVAMTSMFGRAGEKWQPTIDTAVLREFDVSNDIRQIARSEKSLNLKPRSIPGYDQLRSALWSGGPNAPAALLANGADPNSTSKNGEPILHYAVWLNDEKLVSGEVIETDH